MRPGSRARAVLAIAVATAAPPLLLAACGGDESGGDPGVAGLSDSYYAASNLAPALEQVAERVGENATVSVTISQDTVRALAQPKQGGPEVITVTDPSATKVVDASPGTSVAGPLLNDIDPESVQQVVSEVSTQADVEEDNITRVRTLG